jgi:hypothetical protein
LNPVLKIAVFGVVSAAFGAFATKFAEMRLLVPPCFCDHYSVLILTRELLKKKNREI